MEAITMLMPIISTAILGVLLSFTAINKTVSEIYKVLEGMLLAPIQEGKRPRSKYYEDCSILCMIASVVFFLFFSHEIVALLAFIFGYLGIL